MIIKVPDDATKNALIDRLNNVAHDLTAGGTATIMLTDFIPYIADWNDTAKSDIKAVIGDIGVVLDISSMSGADKASLLSTLSTVMDTLDTKAATALGYEPEPMHIVKFYAVVSKGSSAILASAIKGG